MWHHVCHVLMLCLLHSIAFILWIPIFWRPRHRRLHRQHSVRQWQRTNWSWKSRWCVKRDLGMVWRVIWNETLFFFCVCVWTVWRDVKLLIAGGGSRNISFTLTKTLMYCWRYPLGRQWTYLQTFQWQVTCDGNCVVVFLLVLCFSSCCFHSWTWKHACMLTL